jgi:hypothetical protein
MQTNCPRILLVTAAGKLDILSIRCRSLCCDCDFYAVESILSFVITETSSVGFGPQANYTDRSTAAAGEVRTPFGVIGYCVVSATDSYVF